MTTIQDIAAVSQPDALLPMPDPPERTPEELSSFNHLSITGSSHFLAMHLGKPETTLVAGEHYLAPFPTREEAYAALGIPEYWRFDETGRYHGAKLEGDRLVHGAYQPITIQELDEETLQGYSEVLNLILRWEHGQLGWYDPSTGRHIPTFKDQTARAHDAEAALKAEREARAASEAKIRALEQELGRRSS